MLQLTFIPYLTYQGSWRALVEGVRVDALEWACIEALKPHLDVSHCAATPPGLEVRVSVRLLSVEGRRLVLEVEAHDGVELISKGRHERFIVNAARFAGKTRRKTAGPSTVPGSAPCAT